jgi:hypothetical protein
MKQIAIALSLALCATPVLAEDTGNTDIEEGASLLEQGALLFLKGLMSEMEPALSDMTDNMQEFAQNVEPVMRDLSRLMGDLSNYHAPEVLPNGDIIIRRKQPGEVMPDAEIEL